MKSPRKQSGAEDELMHALSAVMSTDALPAAKEECPSANELSLFERGKSDPDGRERLVAHLSACDLCIGFLKTRRRRRSLVKETGLAFAAAAVLVFALVLGFRAPIQTPTKIATVDLRPLFPTRGVETATTAAKIPAISEKVTGLRLILPAGTEGKYECEILSARKDAVLTHVSGETSFQDHQVVLDFPISSSSFRGGDYFLALRKDGDSWAYYPLTLK